MNKDFKFMAWLIACLENSQTLKPGFRVPTATMRRLITEKMAIATPGSVSSHLKFLVTNGFLDLGEGGFLVTEKAIKRFGVEE